MARYSGAALSPTAGAVYASGTIEYRRWKERGGQMKAAFIEQYGGPDVFQYGEFPDPVAGSGEVVVARDAKRIAGMFVQCPHCGTLLYG